MTNEANNNNFRNKLTEDLKKKIQESVRSSFDKNIGGKGKTENAGIRDFEKGVVDKVDGYKKSAENVAGKYKDKGYKAYNEELKKDEEKNKEDYFRKMNEVSSPSNRFNVGPRSPEAFRSGLAADRARIESPVAREAEAQRIKKEATEEAEKRINKDLKDLQKDPKIKGFKRRVVAKVASRIIDEAAYNISQKMAEKANAGGPGAILVIIFTLFLALTTDAIDILGELGVTALIVSIIGTIPGVVLGIALWTFNLICSLIIVIFWMLVLGGGHKKYFWKRVIRTIIVVLFVEIIPYIDIIPFATLMVLWNWSDFAKDKRKAKDDLKAFESEFKTTRGINPKYVKEYGG